MTVEAAMATRRAAQKHALALVQRVSRGTNGTIPRMIPASAAEPRLPDRPRGTDGAPPFPAPVRSPAVA